MLDVVVVVLLGPVLSELLPLEVLASTAVGTAAQVEATAGEVRGIEKCIGKRIVAMESVGAL